MSPPRCQQKLLSRIKTTIFHKYIKRHSSPNEVSARWTEWSWLTGFQHRPGAVQGQLSNELIESLVDLRKGSGQAEDCCGERGLQLVCCMSTFMNRQRRVNEVRLITSAKEVVSFSVCRTTDLLETWWRRVVWACPKVGGRLGYEPMKNLLTFGVDSINFHFL